MADIIRVKYNGEWYSIPALKGDKGDAGRGIVRIYLLSKRDSIATYRIEYTDGSHYDYEVIDGSYASWGEIQGDIVDQEDLKNELDKKQNLLVAGSNIDITSESVINTSTFVYEQGIASDTWYITHNLDKFPSVTVVDTAGNILTCAVRYVDKNTCVVSMNGGFKGKAYLN